MIRDAERMQARDMPEVNLLMNPSTTRVRRAVWKTLSVEAGCFFGNPSKNRAGILNQTL